MRYLGLALFAEGATDHRFLRPLLFRVTEDLLKSAREIVEVSPVEELHSPRENRDSDRATRIAEAARDASGSFHVLFVHADGSSTPNVARRERVEPARGRLAEETACQDKRVVAVVPVRETEAWALADGNALRRAFGTELDDQSLGIPSNPREVERVRDPKQALDDACRNAVRRRRGRKVSGSDFLEAIANRLALSSARQVPAFRRFEKDLCAALASLGYLSKRTT